MEFVGATGISVGNRTLSHYISDLGTPSLNQWHHIVGVWQQGGYSYIYRDGTQGRPAVSPLK